MNFCFFSPLYWSLYSTWIKINLCCNISFCCKLDIVRSRSSYVANANIYKNIKYFSIVLNFAEWDKDEELNETKNVIVYNFVTDVINVFYFQKYLFYKANQMTFQFL